MLPMLAQLCLVSVLYVLLTIARAPGVWGIGRRADGTNPFADLEPRVSANLSNQFEWPLLFFVACLLALLDEEAGDTAFVALAWVFVAGRCVHSCVHILTTSIRLRGLIFTINFLAVLGMFWYLLD